ncbi:MAG: hypothetical protein NTY09_13060 [bacterium]|nr:hypothetical protein [bacterium]
MKGWINQKLAVLFLGLMLSLITGSHLLRLSMERDDIWWTPETMLVTLDNSVNRLDVFVKNERLVDLLDGHKLWVDTGDDFVAVTKEDIGFRINNWDMVRASGIPEFVMNTAGLMLGLVVLLYGVIQQFMKKEKSQA